VAITLPFLHDEYAATAARHAGSPIAFHAFEVLGPLVPDGLRRALDLPAYWAILLIIELPAIYMTGVMAMSRALAPRGAEPAKRRLVVGLAFLAGASLGVAWLFASTIANNDLGWRGVLPGILVLTIFAASGLSQWMASAPTLAAAAIGCLVLGVPDGLRIAEANAVGTKLPSAGALAKSPQVWAAVRRHSAADERVGNDPLLFADSVRWPVNISWALFANRRSCYAGWNLVRAFVALPQPEVDRLETLFDRVFGGNASPRDIHDLAARYDCRVIVVTARDGAWTHDPFAGSRDYHLVETKNGRWRIYRIAENVRDRR
jgi:hypothetical protein